MVFTRQRIAVFIDGCFWHGCPLHHRQPRANGAYWSAKVDGNRRRDAETERVLVAAGWKVLRFWEHVDPIDAANSIHAAVDQASSEQHALSG